MTDFKPSKESLTILKAKQAMYQKPHITLDKMKGVVNKVTRSDFSLLQARVAERTDFTIKQLGKMPFVKFSVLVKDLGVMVK